MDNFDTRRYVTTPNVVTPQASQVTEAGEPKQGTLIDTIQKVLLASLLFLVPIFFLPTPWGIVEHSRGVLIVALGSAVIAIELYKLLSGAKVQIAKSIIDIAIGVFIVSVALSVVLSKDITASFWGYDSRLGSGALVLFLIILTSYVFRGVVKSTSDVALFLRSLLAGISVSALLSILAVLGTDVIGWLTGLDLLIPNGISVLGSPQVAVFVWITGVLITLILLTLGTDRKYTFIHLIALNLNLWAIILFTAVQSLMLPIMTALMLITVLVVIYARRTVEGKSVLPWVYASLAIIVIGSGIVRIPAVKEMLTTRVELVQQVVLDTETSWKISIASLSDSVRSGFFGFGHDAFSVAYNRYRPTFMGEIDLSTVTYSSANSEFMTVIGTRGLVGALVWVALIATVGFYIYKKYYEYSRAGLDLATTLTGIGVLFLLVMSLFMSFSVMNWVIVFMLLAAVVSLEALYSPREAQYFVAQMNFRDERIASRNVNSFNFVAAFVAVIVATAGLFVAYRHFGSAIYAIQAEKLIAEETQKSFDGKEYTNIELQNISQEAAKFYGKAIEIDSSNSFLYRRASTLVMQYVQSLVDEASAAEEPEKAFEEISSTFNVNISSAEELTKSAVERARYNYQNWDTRAFVLTRAVGYGMASYLPEAYGALEASLSLNPNNPAIYYNFALMYDSEAKYTEALAAVQQALSLRLDLEPVLLAAQLNIELDRPDEGKSYLEATLKALEETELQESELYKAIVKRIAEIDAAIKADDISTLKKGSNSEAPIEVPEGEDEIDLDIELPENSAN